MKQIIPCLWLGCAALGRLVAQDVISETEIPAVTPVEDGATAETAPAAVNVMDEVVIPQAYPESRYQATWSTNPFLGKVDVNVNPTIDWSKDWALAGMYKSTTGKINISLQNKQTAEFKRVTSDGDANSEFKLVTANFNRNRNEASVDIEKDGKRATLKYDDNLTSRPVTVSNTFKTPGAQPGGVPGNPNLRPGQPGQPGQPVNVTGSPRMPVQPNIQPGAMTPGGMPNNGQPAAASPPTISRRRQLIPAPVVAPPTPQQ